MQPVVWASDPLTGTSETVLPQVSITWKYDEVICGGYVDQKPDVVHPVVSDNGRVEERIICLDLDDEPWPA